jgi:hypothetical protein
MNLKLREYDVLNDFKLVRDFLAEYHQPDNRDGNFPEPAWEYMHGHPWLDEESLNKIGVWEDLFISQWVSKNYLPVTAG